MKKGYYVLFLFLAIASSCHRHIHLANIERTQYTVGKDTDGLEANQELIDMISPYKAALDEEMNTLIGTMNRTMYKRKPESEMTNWLGDVLYRQASEVSGQQIDFAIMNYGGIRLPQIQEGEIKTGTIFELMPFDNYVVILELDGRTVRSLFDKIAAAGGGWPVSKHVLLVIDDRKVDKLLIGGKTIEDDRIYSMVTSDFLADAGDGLSMLPDQTRYEFDLLIRDAIIKDVKEMTSKEGSVTSSSSGRIIQK